MSTDYSGAPTSVTTTANVLVGITSSTNASPIVVQTAAAHNVLTGDWVQIAGHLVNTNANGLWQATATNPTHVALIGSTGNGVGGATGYLTDVSLHPQSQITADGDTFDAASVNASIENLHDRTNFLNIQDGSHRTVYDNVFTVADGGETLGDIVSWTTNAYGANTYNLLFIPSLKVGDIVKATLSTTMRVNGNNIAIVRLQCTENGGGVLVPTGAHVAFGQNTNNSGVPVTMFAHRVVATAGDFQLSADGRIPTPAGGDYLKMIGGLVCNVVVLRPNL